MKMFLLSALMLGLSFGAFGQIDLVKNITTEAPEKWEITPKKGITKGMGCLNLVFADSVIWSVDIYNSSKKFLDNHSIMDRRNADDTKNYYELTPGIYNFKLNTVMVENVPIEEGKETRLRTGVLDIITAGNWELRSETKQKFLTSGNKPKKIALPVGTYQLRENGNYRLVKIIDEINGLVREITETDTWVFNELPDSKGLAMKNAPGRLDLTFPEGEWCTPISGCSHWWYDAKIHLPSWKTKNWYVNILDSFNRIISLNNENIDSQIIRPGIRKPHYFHDLAAGNYEITVNKIPVKNIPIQSGRETRIKTGLIKIGCRSGNSVTWYGNSDPFYWYIYDISKSYHYYHFWGNAGAIIVLPVGVYGFKLWGSCPVDRLVVRDNEEICINIEISQYTIVSTRVTWEVYDANGFPAPYKVGGNLNDQVRITFTLPNGEYIIKYNSESGPKSRSIILGGSVFPEIYISYND